MHNNNIQTEKPAANNTAWQPPVGAADKPKPPVIKTIGIILGTYVGYFLVQIIANRLIKANGYVGQFLVAVPIFVFMVAMMILIGKKKALLTNGNGFWGGLLTGGFIVYSSVMAVVQVFLNIDREKNTMEFKVPEGMSFGTEQIWCILAMLLSAGICEELMFRGIIYNTLRDAFGRNTVKGTFAAVFVSGALFGMMHFLNLTGGVPFRVVLIQVVSTMGMGIFFAAIYSRWGNLKVTMFLHFLMDICMVLPVSMQSSSDLSDSITETMDNPMKFMALPLYIGLALFVMRKSVRHEMFTYSVDDDVHEMVNAPA
ncbi:CPBP family intramembrane glutamic endopeptidase [uncultured Ruminococcus sp.]|uniref:CPBP family intramembrane glutamic endopeptidase n=1 Tax=uncultured Ruminococcus sp. TaxID=165186 RepID=UPI0025E97E61|nr:type II CAAX endopeptidase family protein [uncultured Ruminococcus sp.]